jgi:hypothetical protein
MRGMKIDAIRGLVYVRPEDGIEYGPIRTFGPYPGIHPATAPGRELIAEDSCGNIFILASDGSVLFWDHETGELTLLAQDWASFVSGCATQKPITFDKSKVKSAWINPAFTKELRDPKQ